MQSIHPDSRYVSRVGNLPIPETPKTMRWISMKEQLMSTNLLEMIFDVDITLPKSLNMSGVT